MRSAEAVRGRPMRAWTWGTRIVVLVALALSAVGCDTAPRDGQGDGSTSPPDVETPGRASTGTLDERIVVGDWTVLVREAKFDDDGEDRGGADETERVPGTVEETRTAPVEVTFEVELSHDSSTPLTVRTNDWALDDGEGGVYVPTDTVDKPEDRGERTIGAGATEDVKVSFSVPNRSGAYILRFEPIEGGPGVLQVAVP
jgi:hypothetical protein